VRVAEGGISVDVALTTSAASVRVTVGSVRVAEGETSVGVMLAITVAPLVSTAVASVVTSVASFGSVDWAAI